MKQPSFDLLLFKDVGLGNHLLGSGQIAMFAGEKIWYWDTLLSVSHYVIVKKIQNQNFIIFRHIEDIQVTFFCFWKELLCFKSSL